MSIFISFSEFVQLMDFKKLPIDEGLREFQSHFRMTVSSEEFLSMLKIASLTDVFRAKRKRSSTLHARSRTIITKLM
jgi:hypothetical protein